MTIMSIMKSLKSVWFLARDKKNGLGGRGKKMRDRRHETLFIDARKLGTLTSAVTSH